MMIRKPRIRYWLGGNFLLFFILMMRGSVSLCNNPFNYPHCLIIILTIKRGILKTKI